MSARRLLHDRSAAGAAEFAMVLPLLILLLFGIIDAGRFMWEYNRAEKATQVGARMAVVTNVIPGGLAAQSYLGNTAGGTALTQGDLISRLALGKIVCTNTACCNPTTLCTTPYPALGTYDAATFTAIVTRMRYMKPDITAANVRVEYSGSGLGYAGDPNGMDVSPLVTVRLTGVRFSSIATLFFVNFTMPDTLTTLTAEDSVGSQSN